MTAFSLLLLSVAGGAWEPLPLTLTWYDGPGPNTACGDAFDPHAVKAASPPWIACGEVLLVCYERCAWVEVNDRIPESSYERYNGRIIDLTPAAADAVGLAHGKTDGGLAYGRAKAKVYRHKKRAPPKESPWFRPY